MSDSGGITTEYLEQIERHAEQVTGTFVAAAPHYSELNHTKGRLTMATFHTMCTAQINPIHAVKVTPEGEIFEVILDPQEGEFHFDTYMHRPYSTASQAPATFHTTRKKGFKAHERDLSVWYFPDKSLPHNPTATNLFKMQLYGDVLMVQQSREQSFIPRERYVSFTKQCYDEHFAKKRRRSQSDTPSLTPTAYAELKQTMQNSLNEFEHNVSKDAVKPREVVMAYSVITGNHVKQSTASKIAKSLKGRGYTIPKKTSSIGVTPPPSTLDEIKEVLDDVVVAVVDRQGGQGQEWTRG
jgi:hypothetical protein